MTSTETADAVLDDAAVYCSLMMKATAYVEAVIQNHEKSPTDAPYDFVVEMAEEALDTVQLVRDIYMNKVELPAQLDGSETYLVLGYAGLSNGQISGDQATGISRWRTSVTLAEAPCVE